MDWAFSPGQRWHDLWRGEIGEWVITKGLRIVLLLIGAALASRFISWSARRVTRRLERGFAASDALVRSEASKHRQAVASVISWLSVVLLCVMVAVQITSILDIPVGSLVGPAAVLGGAIGFGAQKLVQDLLNHQSIASSARYAHTNKADLRAAMRHAHVTKTATNDETSVESTAGDVT